MDSFTVLLYYINNFIMYYNLLQIVILLNLNHIKPFKSYYIWVERTEEDVKSLFNISAKELKHGHMQGASC